MSTLRFYFDEIRADSDDCWRGAWRAPEDFPYFEGHFPGHPLVPATVLLEISFDFLRAVTDRPNLVAKGAGRCKFKSAVTPGANCRIEARRAGEGSWKVVWTLRGTSVPAAELEILTQDLR